MIRPVVHSDDDLYDALLLDYAAGSIDRGLALVVASHLSLCNRARRQFAVLEDLGGALLAEMCAPVAMESDALASVLNRLTEADEPKPSHSQEPCRESFGCRLPAPLKEHIASCKSHAWRPAPRAQVMRVTLPGSGRRALLIRAEAGLTFTPPHGSRLYLLVLEGAVENDSGRALPGDLLVFDAGTEVTLRACPGGGCACLLVSEPVSWTAKLLSLVRDPF